MEKIILYMVNENAIVKNGDAVAIIVPESWSKEQAMKWYRDK